MNASTMTAGACGYTALFVFVTGLSGCGGPGRAALVPLPAPGAGAKKPPHKHPLELVGKVNSKLLGEVFDRECIGHRGQDILGGLIAPAFLPNLGRLQGGHENLQRTRAIHFFTNDRFYFA